MNQKNILISIICILIPTLGVLSYNLVQRSINPQTNSLFRNSDNDEIGLGFEQGDGNGNKPRTSRGNCLADECLAVDNLNYPTGNLTEAVTSALNKALDDEYKAYSTYDAIINKIGKVRPFIMIIRAEEQHISSLKALFDKYGLTIPENPYIGKISSPNTLAEACTTGVSAEIENASLYKDELLPVVKNYEDITLVFNNLMNASKQKHLGAFQRCAQ